MREDKYCRFRELKGAERVGVDYRICLGLRESPVAIIAPHGGTIEPGTSQIAAAIAGDDFNLYCFEGLRRRPHSHLHISSTRYDEPQCLELVQVCDIVVAVHGLRGTSSRIDVGGRDHGRRDGTCAALNAAGFDARAVTTGEHAAVSAKNVCNRGRSRAGVQLEITKGLRDRLLSNSGRGRMVALADAIRVAIL